MKYQPRTRKPATASEALLGIVETHFRQAAHEALDELINVSKQYILENKGRWVGSWPNSQPQAAKSPYAVLGLTPKASMDQVEKAFRKQVLKFHPDRQGGDSTKLQEALAAVQQIRAERGAKAW